MSKRGTIGKKTLLGSACIPLWVFSMQMLLQQRYYVGGAAALIATGLFAAYEYLGIRSLPVDAEELRDLSEQLGSTAEQVAGGNSAAPPGTTRDPETGKFQPVDGQADDQQQTETE